MYMYIYTYVCMKYTFIYVGWSIHKIYIRQIVFADAFTRDHYARPGKLPLHDYQDRRARSL